ncbi:hypothetical protein SASPL_150591 [Salvia splendens]|uniref:Pentatricopeptide repeat-containing protein n=1 Tax=Salvia splendens TaxID=180675 RepID=A0A8X8Z2Y9_SALSN|nr:hypothetical protein SASPL_150591 [Salvia splendens]
MIMAGYNKKGDEEIQFGSHEESLILRRQRKLLGAWIWTAVVLPSTRYSLVVEVEAEDSMDLAAMGAVVTDVVKAPMDDEFLKHGIGFRNGTGDEIREKNVVSWNSLLWGYVKCGDLAMALSVFDEMPEKDVVSWTSMVSGYARDKDMEQAYELFRRIPLSFK